MIPRALVSIAFAGLAFGLAAACAGTGTAPSDAEGGGAPEDGPARFRFVSLTSVPGSVPLGNPWSPTEAVLVFNAGSGPPSFRAIDLSEPSPEPWELVDATIGSVDWSPDGTWIVADAVENTRRSARTLIALPVGRDAVDSESGRDIEALAAGAGTVRFLWGRDGLVWYMPDVEPEEWHFVEPPDVWREKHPEPIPPAPQFVVHDGPWTPDTPTFRVYIVETGPEEFRERILPLPEPIAGSMSLVDVFPDRTRLLTQIFPFGAAGFAAIVDLQGRVCALFESHEEPVEATGGLSSVRTSFNPQSVSRDGRFVVGTRTVEDGHSIGESVLYIGDAQGRWTAPLEDAPQGAGPRFSRSGDFLVFANSDSRLLEIGRVEVIE